MVCQQVEKVILKILDLVTIAKIPTLITIKLVIRV